jgi:hypothetical protein
VSSAWPKTANPAAITGMGSVAGNVCHGDSTVFDVSDSCLFCCRCRAFWTAVVRMPNSDSSTVKLWKAALKQLQELPTAIQQQHPASIQAGTADWDAGIADTRGPLRTVLQFESLPAATAKVWRQLVTELKVNNYIPCFCAHCLYPGAPLNHSPGVHYCQNAGWDATWMVAVMTDLCLS